mmetsp:Transcript_22755/g.33932  ORF Transcript_22755/g.33932 Transcript_22755/m.33932 type:complete len:185 (+) Transcript_22755:263-817(+)
MGAGCSAEENAEEAGDRPARRKREDKSLWVKKRVSKAKGRFARSTQSRPGTSNVKTETARATTRKLSEENSLADCMYESAQALSSNKARKYIWKSGFKTRRSTEMPSVVERLSSLRLGQGHNSEENESPRSFCFHVEVNVPDTNVVIVRSRISSSSSNIREKPLTILSLLREQNELLANRAKGR